MGEDLVSRLRRVPLYCASPFAPSATDGGSECSAKCRDIELKAVALLDYSVKCALERQNNPYDDRLVERHLQYHVTDRKFELLFCADCSRDNCDVFKRSQPTFF